MALQIVEHTQIVNREDDNIIVDFVMSDGPQHSWRVSFFLSESPCCLSRWVSRSVDSRGIAISSPDRCDASDLWLGPWMMIESDIGNSR